MPDFSSTNQPTSEAKRRGWTFKQTMERLLSDPETPLGVNDRVPLHERIVRAHLRKALDEDAGDAARRELYDRVDGKVTDKTEITGADGKDLIPPASELDVARRLAFLLEKGLRAASPSS